MLTTHVVSQDLAEELKRNGWPQEGSAFYWKRDTEDGVPYLIAGNSRYMSTEGVTIACPLASELMERLPDFVNLSRSHRGCHASILDRDLEPIEEIADTLPDALAKLALHLMKEGKWKP